MTSSILQDAAAGRAIIQPWTVDLYHHAIEQGWLEERTAFELLDGFVVRKDRATAGENPVTVGDRHRLAVQRLVKLAPCSTLLAARCRCSSRFSYRLRANPSLMDQSFAAATTTTGMVRPEQPMCCASSRSPTTRWRVISA